MNTSELEQILFAELGYAGKPGLVTDPNTLWANGRPIPDIDTALFLNHIPLAYFSRFSELDPDKIQQLHKNVWSQSKTPLLFVTLPHEIRIYNGYASPEAHDDATGQPLLKHLTNLTDHLVAQHHIQRELVETNYYERVYLETGAFWDSSDGRRIVSQPRADKRLVESMGQLRKELINQGLTNAVAYTLLGRSIFIRYLEARKILTETWVQQLTDGKAHNFLEALAQGYDVTSQLFERLSQRFNGDLFPVNKQEERNIDDGHLTTLVNFLSGTDLKTRQLSLWPYNFEFIPIELISHIYDTFIDNQRESGAYYTPLLLADFILEETMGSEVVHPNLTVLDPACGSGIFLVGAYRRLVQAWRRQNGQPTAQDLARILQQNIYGVDKNSEAVRIAAFSLYLEILNHLSNEQVKDETFRFPSLQQQNLLHSDFFAEEVDQYFIGRKFDRIVGNLPWGENTLTSKAEKWLMGEGYKAADNQAAPAFMLHAPQFCKQTGEIALLTSTRSSILVTSRPHRDFRDLFFRTFNVRAVVNFSALRRHLFGGAVSPATAIFYSPLQPVSHTKLIYSVPKPSRLSQHLKAIILDTPEIKFLNREDLIEQPELWKVAQWGTHRDAGLISRLRNFPSLISQLRQLEWDKLREGFHPKEGLLTERHPTPDYLKRIPFLPIDKFQPFFINVDNLKPVEQDTIKSPRKEETYKGPMVLIHQSKCQAAFVESDISFTASISRVKGTPQQNNLLKWLVCVINSPITQYYQFLTSTRWGVERSNPLQKEYEEMPFLIPDEKDPLYQKLILCFDQLVGLMIDKPVIVNWETEQHIEELKLEINRLVFQIYDLHPVEQQLIEDMLVYGVAFFEWTERKNLKFRDIAPIEKPDERMLRVYAETFIRTTAMFLQIKQQALNAIVYRNGHPLTVMTFEFVDVEDVHPVQVITQPTKMREKLRELDDLLVARKTPSMYMRRHVRVYDGKQISLIRPSEKRFWTESQARADADAFLADLFE